MQIFNLISCFNYSREENYSRKDIIIEEMQYVLMIMFGFIFIFFSLLAEGTNCVDAEYSSTNDRFKNLWLNSEVYYSYDACNSSKRDSKFNSKKLCIFVTTLLKSADSNDFSLIFLMV